MCRTNSLTRGGSMMFRTRLGLWARIACAGAMLNSLAYFSHAQCTNGCMEGSCFKMGLQCYQPAQTDCIKFWRTVYVYGNKSYGAVGGTQKDTGPSVNWYQVPFCSKECAKTNSRALNSQGMSTCSGSQTNPTELTLCYCGS